MNFFWNPRPGQAGGVSSLRGRLINVLILMNYFWERDRRTRSDKNMPSGKIFLNKTGIIFAEEINGPDDQAVMAALDSVRAPLLPEIPCKINPITPRSSRSNSFRGNLVNNCG